MVASQIGGTPQIFQVMDDLLSIETYVVGDTPDTANTLAARTAPVTSYARCHLDVM